MNRRGFLGSLLGGVAALALDPERLLWVPGAKKIFIPAAPVVPTWIVDMGYRQFIHVRSEHGWKVGQVVMGAGHPIGVAISDVPAGHFGYLQVYGEAKVVAL